MTARLARVTLLAAAAALAAACSHDSPFATDHSSTVPFEDGNPARLTYNAGRDADPSWSPDGSLLVYAAAEPESHEADECAAMLPATGGRIVRRVCRPDRAGNGQYDYVHFPALNARGDVALIAGQHIMRNYGEESFALAVVRGGAWREVMTFPRTLEGQFFVRPDALAWLTDDVVVMLSGGRLISMDTGDSAATPALLPAASPITAIAAGPAAGSLFVLHAFDDNVYLYDAATGTETVRFTFAGPELIDLLGATAFGAVLRVSLPGGGARLVALDCADERTVGFADPEAVASLALNPASGDVVFGQAADLYLVGNAAGQLPSPACAAAP